MGKISEIFNFDDIGKKIKNLAKWSCWITILLIWIAAPISFIVLVFDERTAELCWIPLVGAIVGPVFVWIGSWAMYAFGEFVEDIHAMRNKEGTTTEVNAKREAEIKAKYEAEKKMRREAEERAKREAEEAVKRELEIRKKSLSAKPAVTKAVVPMNKPNNFQNNIDWQNNIATLSDNEIYIRYIDEVEWSETYRYHCYLELKKRNLQSIQIITNHSEEQNELKILPNGKGYICPLCGFSNTSFSYCAKCSYNPFENPSEATNDSEDEYVDISCPACGETLSFLKNETKGVCPNCDTEFEIK